MSVITVNQSNSVIEVTREDNKIIELGSSDAKVIVVSGDQGVPGATGDAATLHEGLVDVTADQHHPQTHAPESHSDTNITGAELEALSDGSEISLHIHDDRYYTETEVNNLLHDESHNHNHNSLANIDGDTYHLNSTAYDHLSAQDQSVLIDASPKFTTVDLTTLTNSLADLAINASAGNNIIIKLGDDAAANKVSFTNSTPTEVASIDSLGLGTFAGLEADKIGVGASISTDSMIQIAGELTGDLTASISIGTVFSPAAPSTTQHSGIGGYAIIGNNNCQGVKEPAASAFLNGINGLGFSIFNNADRTIVDGAGIAVAGAMTLASTLTATNIWGIYCQPWSNVFGGGLNVENLYGIQVVSSDAGGGTIENQFGIVIEKPIRGTNNYQFVLNGTGDGSGAFIGGILGTRLFVDGSGRFNIVTNLTVAKDLIIACGTEKTLRLVAPVYEDQQMNLGNTRWSGVNDPHWVDYKGGQVVAFRPSTVNRVYFNLEFSHKIKSNSTTYFHIHVVRPLTGNGTTADWELTVCYTNQGAAFPGVTTILKTQTVGVVGDHETLVFTDVFVSGAEFSGIAICSLARLGTGSYDEDMYMLFGDAHFEVDTMGARLPFAK